MAVRRHHNSTGSPLVAVDIAIKNGWMHAGTFGISTALQHPLATYDIPELIALAKSARYATQS